MESEPMRIGRSSPTPTHINRPIDKPGCLTKIWNCFSQAISKLIECLKNIVCCRQSDPKISTFKKSYELQEDDEGFIRMPPDSNPKISTFKKSYELQEDDEGFIHMPPDSKKYVAPIGRTLEEELHKRERQRDPLVRAKLI